MRHYAHGPFPSDVWFADVDPAGAAPEFAIGHLPVLSAAEFAQAIAKIQTREAATGAEWLKRVLMVSENAGNFALPWVPAGVTPDIFRPGSQPL